LTYQVTPFQVTLLGSGVRLKTPHKCFQVADTYSGGTLHMHQRQLTAGDRWAAHSFESAVRPTASSIIRRDLRGMCLSGSGTAAQAGAIATRLRRQPSVGRVDVGDRTGFR